MPQRDNKLEFTSDPETGRGPGHPSPGFGRFQQPTGAVTHAQSFRLRGQVTQCLSNSERSDWKQRVSCLGAVCQMGPPLCGTPAVTWPCFSVATTGRVGERTWEQLSALEGGRRSAHAALTEGRLAAERPLAAVLVSFPAVATSGFCVSWGLNQGPRATPASAAGAPFTRQDRNSTPFMCPERAWGGLRGCSAPPGCSLLKRAWPCPVPPPPAPVPWEPVL